ncbi:exodeoxyribonuclease VII large subunit [Candidatus Paracaedibacter acanthamoebae]|uniref:Exodeoxyribonuclease 7 large subunit n=1 Tax=Candidatus Odyssella acanthamoebae TaxID=91604 RepID=A0A077AWP7_9PROT|nr:exodeoxyribonuclease VII large subunit [Candidatus Paracaedibacter acanthamoebae]
MTENLPPLTQSPLMPVLTVSDLSVALKRTVEDQFGFVRIKGEISGLKRHTSGHIYYALKDENAVIDAVSWRGSYSNNPIQLEEGLEIIATGRVTTYPARSKYQMIVESYEASGQGALLKLLEDRKRQLQAEGLFASDRKKKIPSFPQTIGVITSPTGAVIRDILHRIEDRFPCHVIVWPVLVQGPGAAEQVAAAIKGFNALPHPPDVLIVARGGGSLEDLWAFNEEIVVRAAAESRLPLISAIGHETDTTLIDYAADLRAPTPTGAAEFAVPVLLDLLTYLQDRDRRQQDVMRQLIDNRQLRLSALERGLVNPQRLLEDGMQRLDDWADRLTRALPQFCQNLQERLGMTYSRLRRPHEVLEISEERLAQLSTRLEQASFHKVLERGFALITNPKGAPITAAKTFPDTPVHLTFADGTVEVIKTGVHPARPKSRGAKPAPQQPRLF